MFESTGTNAVTALTAGLKSLNRNRRHTMPTWLTAIRDEGSKLFEKAGLPTRRHEEWKYTDLSALNHKSFSVPTPNASVEFSGPSDLLPYLLSQQEAFVRLVLVDGCYSAQLSTVNNLPGGVEVKSLGQVLAHDQDRLGPLLSRHLANYAMPGENSFVALNNAYLEDGAFVYVPAGVKLNMPVHLVYLSTSHQSQLTAVHHPRNLVIVEKDAQLTLIEDYIGVAGSNYFNNTVSEILLGEGADVDHYKFQRESEDAYHIATIQVQQEKNSRFSSQNLSFGSQLTRNDINSQLSGPGAQCQMNGLSMIRGSQHVDNHTLIHHAYPDCTSTQLYHNIMDENARGVFNGKIYVEPEAQKTDSQQTNRTLMLSRHARMDTKPQLEIFADDVKCSHGATVGRIDDDALYYLRSRGVSAGQARKMLTQAFGQRMTNLFRLDSIKEAIDLFIADRLEEWHLLQSENN